MKLTNEDVRAALEAMAQVCGGGNRLPTLAALRAFRIKATLAKAWESCDELRLQLCRDHGKPNEDGSRYVFDSAEGRAAFDDGWKKLCAEERELDLETLALAEIEAGHYRGETGKKESGLDLTADALGTLVRVGIVTVPKEEA